MGRRVVTVAVAVGLTVALGACDLLSTASLEVIEVTRIEDEPRAVFVLYGGCEGGLPVNVVEEADRVVFEVGRGDPRCDAIQGTRVELAEPLGDRSVVDARTGEPVPVSSAD